MENKGFILCVDDQPEVIDMLLVQLERAVGDECIIEVAESADEALKVFHELEDQGEIIELVITDEIMPGLKGSRFLEAIHEHDPDIMTMMLTGHAGLDDVIYAVNHGRLAKCLKKPWSSEELQDIVVTLLEQTRTNRRNKRLAQQVIDEKNKAEAIVHSISDGILVIDSSDKVSLMNAACVRILGLSERELYGKRLLDVVKVKELILLHMAASKQSNEVVSDEIALPSPQDTNATLYIIAIAKTLRDKSGKPLGIVTVLRDITQEKEINAMKANFLATVSHELRTPLTSIISTFELLAQEVLGALTQEQREFIDSSREQGSVLAELIENLIDLSTLEAGNMELHTEACDSALVIHEAAQPFQPAIHTKGLQFSCEFEPALPQIVADKAQILRLFTLLLSNAVKFTQKGNVCVKIAHTSTSIDDRESVQEELHYAISDSGIGITQTHQNRVFEKFYQVDSSTTREFKGSGLGLSVCKAIVEAHQGRIWLESELHKGTTVHVVLPVTQSSHEDVANA